MYSDYRLLLTPTETQPVYLGPDALMPIASVFAAVAGFVMMFWRRLIGAVRMLVSRITGRTSPGTES